jgi:hypothetical protein
MAQAKPLAPYDPVRSVVAMWNGTITRLGYLFKDPVTYGAEPTKAVLNSTSRRYQDALDDCEIQILEAKWYLEHQLKLNREKREAAQAEKKDASSTKRKLAEFQGVQTANGDAATPDEKPAKRQHVGDEVPEKSVQEPEKEMKAEQKSTSDEAAADKTKEPPSDQKRVQMATTARPDTIVSEPVQPKQPPDRPPAPAPVKVSTKDESRPSTSYGGRGPPSQSGQNTPATAAEEFNFESMFGDPSGDPNDAAGLTFDNIDLANTDQIDGNNIGGFDDPNAFNLGDTSLNNLLPGLESYAKQSGDHGDGAGGYDFGNAGDVGGSVGNEFALPDLGGSTFDDFLNDNTFGDGTGGDGGDDFLKDGEMMNLDDLDASFFDNP